MEENLEKIEKLREKLAKNEQDQKPPRKRLRYLETRESTMMDEIEALEEENKAIRHKKNPTIFTDFHLVGYSWGLESCEKLKDNITKGRLQWHKDVTGTNYKTVHLDADSTSSWGGLRFWDESNGGLSFSMYAYKTTDRGQWHEKKISSKWIIHKVNEIILSSDTREEVKKLLTETKPECDIVFEYLPDVEGDLIGELYVHDGYEFSIEKLTYHNGNEYVFDVSETGGMGYTISLTLKLKGAKIIGELRSIERFPECDWYFFHGTVKETKATVRNCRGLEYVQDEVKEFQKELQKAQNKRRERAQHLGIPGAWDSAETFGSELEYAESGGSYDWRVFD